jgi:hypothetical protein
VNSVSFSPNGNYIISKDWSNVVIYWNTSTFTQEPTPPSIETLGTDSSSLLVNQPLALDSNNRVQINNDTNAVSFIVPPNSENWITAQPTPNMQVICGIRDVRVCIWIVQ